MAQRPRNRTYSALTLLGNSQAALPSDPRKAKLETFTNQYRHRDYEVEITCPEFTSLCPVTGQPDFADIAIKYIANERCIETKSLKLYLSAFRNTASFNEEVVNRILDDLVKVCQPRWMQITGKFVPRGGLALTVVAEHRAKGSQKRRTP